MTKMPVILVTGTPGVGKTTFSAMLAERFNMLHVPVSALISEKHLWNEKDESRDCTIYDEQLLDDEIRNILHEHPDGGIVFDFHCSDICPIDSIDFVIVLTCDSDILYQRLLERGYGPDKIKENVEAEIFRVILDEVIEDFPENKIVTFQSNEVSDLNTALDEFGKNVFGQ